MTNEGEAAEDGNGRAAEIAQRREQRKERSRRRRRGSAHETDDTSETDEMHETSKTSGTHETDRASETNETDDADTRPVREETQVTMYLTEEQARDVDLLFSELDLEHKRQYGEALQKNRDFYPALIEAAQSEETIRELLDLDTD